MKVLLCHNYYQQRGGEDNSFEAEAAMLESRGHEVTRYTVHNDAIREMVSLSVAGRTLWNPRTTRDLGKLIRRERPDVMHCTNTFPLISPSAYRAAQRAGVAVVQSLRNYRIACVGATLMRDGKVCESCLGKTIGWPGVVRGCYRGSRLASATVAALNAAHWAAGTWTRRVDRYFALTAFAREKYIQAGLPAERIAVKPNFVDPDPGAGAGDGGYVLFVGRLSVEKGVSALLRAWREVKGPIKLKLAGDGSMMGEVRSAAASDPRIVPLGQRCGGEVLELMGRASCVIVPSLWYEGMPRTVVEAYAKGTPVVGSNIGSVAELVADGETGLLTKPGDADDLAAKVQTLLSQPQRLAAMRSAARRAYLNGYTAERNHEMLLAIYGDAIRERAMASNVSRQAGAPVTKAEGGWRMADGKGMGS